MNKPSVIRTLRALERDIVTIHLRISGVDLGGNDRILKRDQLRTLRLIARMKGASRGV
jgi:hypothetical protein